MKLKPISALNDYVAILRTIDIPEGLEVDKDMMEKISNEGVVVGIGPDALGQVVVGDTVIFQKRMYLAIQPQSGGYEGMTVIFVRKTDMIAKLQPTTKYEFE